MDVDVWVYLFAKPLRHDHHSHLEIIPAESGAVEVVGGLDGRTAETGEHVSVVIEGTAEMLGDDKDQLAVSHGFYDLFDHEPTEDLRPLLLT